MPKLLLLLMFNFSWRCFRCHEEVKKRYGYDSGYYEQINETDPINLIKRKATYATEVCVYSRL